MGRSYAAQFPFGPIDPGAADTYGALTPVYYWPGAYGASLCGGRGSCDRMGRLLLFLFGTVPTLFVGLLRLWGFAFGRGVGRGRPRSYRFFGALHFVAASSTAAFVAAGLAVVGLFVLGAGEFVGQGAFQHLVAQKVLDEAEFAAVALAHQCDGYAAGTGTGGAAYAVHVVLGVMGHVEVHHHGYVVDVDAARQDVGGHEYVGVGVAEVAHHHVAGFLLEVGVHLGHGVVPAAQLAGELLDLELGRCEHYHAL